MLDTMMVVVVAAALAVVFFVALSRSRKTAVDAVRETTPALDGWVREALEHELAALVLGTRNSTEHERRKLARTLTDDPDAGIVEKIEEAVKGVELEFVRYSHESDVETTVRVRYENGKVGASSRRIALADLPEAVRTDFEAKGSTRVFRAWTFPWQRVVTL